MSKQQSFPEHPCYHLLSNIPSSPGVYQMFDDKKHIIYIGKAINLRKRVASYFRAASNVKTSVMMTKVVDIQVIVVDSEQEALLLEANLIKEHKPRYNILLRDDKSYPYLYLDVKHPFPRLDFYRGSCKKKGRYFGPYPNAGAVREILSWTQKLFKIRQCSDSFFSHRSRPCLQYHIKRCTAPCVQAVTEDDYADQVEQVILFLTGRLDKVIELLQQKMHIAAEQHDYEQAALYRDQIKEYNSLSSSSVVAGARGDIDVLAIKMVTGHAAVNLILVRGGRIIGQHTFLPKVPTGFNEQEVLSAFISQYYLQSERVKNSPEKIIVDRPLSDLKWLQKTLSGYCSPSPLLLCRGRGVQLRWLSMAASNAEIVLQQYLQRKEVLVEQLDLLQKELQLPNSIDLIECFDISHSQGEATVASCVVCDQKGMNRQAYRRFNIGETVTAGDDYAALYEAMTRRYSRQKKENKPLPDLLLIDGGKGQLTQAEKVCEDLQISGVLLVAIAKGPERRAGKERLFISGAEEEVCLEENSPALHLLQRIRDEAHRFAITGHRSRRRSNRLQSVLQTIPGIGEQKRQALLQYFGGLQGVKSASCEQLTKVSGISIELAKRIRKAIDNDGV